MTVVDPRTAADFEETLRARVPGYLPGWDPTPGGAGAALLAIAARMSAVVADRLNRAPAKNQLAFLDMLGVSLLPAQAARAPVAFTLRPGLGDSRAPAGTQVGATVPGVNGPLIFETERDIALAGAKLVEIATVLPGSDEWASHTSDYESRQSFRLFDGLRPIGHELYLAHDVHFALQGQCEVQVQFELTATGGRRIATLWEYWDGDGWRPFAPFVRATRAGDSDSIDGTDGLTRSGTVVLRVDGASAKRRVVNWVDSYWIRARCADPLTPDFAAHLPAVDRVVVGSVVAPPIGSLRLQNREQPDPEKWPSSKVLSVNAFQALSLSAEPASASASITQLGVPDDKAYVDTRSLASGSADLGPVPAAAQGSYLLTVRVPGFITAAAVVTMSNSASRQEVVVVEMLGDRRPEKGASGGLPLDLSKPFYPFGPSPQPGATCYLLANDALSKPGAHVTMVLDNAASGLRDFAAKEIKPEGVDAQYFDGDEWQTLDVQGLSAAVFTSGGRLKFVVPPGCAPTSVNGVDGYWIRFRITSGTFGQTRQVTIGRKGGTTINTREVIPPVLGRIRYAYYYRSPLEAPTSCHTCNDFAWADHSVSVLTRGSPFNPFSVVKDPTPAVYFGFDAPLPQDVLSIYVDVEQAAAGEASPALVWECIDENSWRPTTIEDETAGMSLPGIVRIAYPGVTPLPSARGVQIAPDTIRPTDPGESGLLRVGDIVSVGDDTGSEPAVIAAVQDKVITFTKPTAKAYPRATVTKTGPARFGTARPAWIRARLRNDTDPPARKVNVVSLNTAWASNVQTRRGEVLGTSDGNPGQSMSCTYTPVLAGERIEVLELSGPRAAVDHADLRDDVLAHGGTEDDLRVVTDSVTGAVAEVWVRWTAQPNLYFSGPTDRHYTIERTRGLVVFGDDRHGRIPPSQTDGIRVSEYRSGGGRVGNVGAGAITQLLSGIPAGSVTNIRAAEGGADGERPDSVLSRGPASVAARSQAVTVADYEVLAREASPAVAFARALPAADPTGRPRPGFVRLVVVPDSPDPRPMPPFVLRRQVQDYVRRRCPASMMGHVYVVGPDYQPVGVVAEIVPVDLDSAGPVSDAVATAAAQFMHPLTGGPEGSGWAFGRDVHLSDVAKVIGGVAGVDYVRTLELLLDGTPHGDVVPVPPQRIVAAGVITVRVAGGE